MYLFDSNKDGALTLFSDIALPAAPKVRSLFDALTGEEKPHSIGSLLLTLVLLLHLSAVIWLRQPAEPFTKAQPMAMEVSLIAAPNRQPAAAPAPAPAPAQAKQEEAKKQPDKKPIKKKPLIRKQAELPKPSAVDEPMPMAPSFAESVPAPIAPSAASSLSNRPAPEAAPFTEANFNANYGSNPKPKYPGIASSRGWEGTVRLLVKVSAEGDSEEVTVQRSSGHEVLDEAAIEAVEKWKFIPAKRGETPVPSTVIVPIDFVLNH